MSYRNEKDNPDRYRQQQRDRSRSRNKDKDKHYSTASAGFRDRRPETNKSPEDDRDRNPNNNKKHYSSSRKYRRSSRSYSYERRKRERSRSRSPRHQRKYSSSESDHHRNRDRSDSRHRRRYRHRDSSSASRKDYHMSKKSNNYQSGRDRQDYSRDFRDNNKQISSKDQKEGEYRDNKYSRDYREEHRDNRLNKDKDYREKRDTKQDDRDSREREIDSKKEQNTRAHRDYGDKYYRQGNKDKDNYKDREGKEPTKNYRDDKDYNRGKIESKGFHQEKNGETERRQEERTKEEKEQKRYSHRSKSNSRSQSRRAGNFNRSPQAKAPRQGNNPLQVDREIRRTSSRVQEKSYEASRTAQDYPPRQTIPTSREQGMVPPPPQISQVRQMRNSDIKAPLQTQSTFIKQLPLLSTSPSVPRQLISPNLPVLSDLRIHLPDRARVDPIVTSVQQPPIMSRFTDKLPPPPPPPAAPTGPIRIDLGKFESNSFVYKPQMRQPQPVHIPYPQFTQISPSIQNPISVAPIISPPPPPPNFNSSSIPSLQNTTIPFLKTIMDVKNAKKLESQMGNRIQTVQQPAPITMIPPASVPSTHMHPYHHHHPHHSHQNHHHHHHPAPPQTVHSTVDAKVSNKPECSRKMDTLIDQAKQICKYTLPKTTLLILDAYRKLDANEMDREVFSVNGAEAGGQGDWKGKLDQEKFDLGLMKVQWVDKIRKMQGYDTELPPNFHSYFKHRSQSFHLQYEQKIKRIEEQLKSKFRSVGEISRKILMTEVDIENAKRKRIPANF